MKRIASFLALILFSAFTFAGSIGAPTNIDFGSYSIKGLSEVTDSVELTLSPSGISENGIGVEVVDDAEDIFWASNSWLYPNGTPDFHGVKKAKVYFYATEKGTYTAKLRLTDYDTEAYEDVQLKVVITDEAIVAKTIPFERIETTSGLKDGDTIVFVCESAGEVSGPLDGAALSTISVTLNNGKAEVPEEGVQMFRASKYSGGWQFYTADAAAKRLHLDIESNSGKGAFTYADTKANAILATWGVEITNGDAVVSRPDDDQTYPVRWVSGGTGGRFKPYKNFTGSDIALYKKAGAAAEIKSKLEIGAIDFGTVELNETKEVTVNYTAENLTEDILWDITGADKALFSVTPDMSTNRTSGSITIKYLGTAAKTVDAKLYALTQDAALDPMEKEFPITITLTPTTIKPTKIEFVGAPTTIDQGQSLDMSSYVVITPNNAADKTLVWSTDHDDQGTVTQAGVLTAKHVTGNIVLTAASKVAPSVSANITLTITKPVITDFTLSDTNVELTIGDTKQLSIVAFVPDYASATATYASNNADIASVNKNGLITAKAAGETTIGEVVKECKVKVNPVTVESVAFDPATKELAVGATYQLQPIINPAAAASQYTVTYESDKTAIATVDANGNVTAIAEGTAVITATVGGKSGQITITVVGAKYFTKVTDPSKMQAGDTIILMANVGENPLVAGQVNTAKNSLDTILGGIMTTANSVACDRALTLVVGGTTDNFTLTKLGTTSTLATSDNTKLGYSTSKNKWKFVAGAAGVMLTNASSTEKNICYNSQSKYIRMYTVGTTSTPLYVYVRPYATPVKPAATGISLDQTSYETHVGDTDITLKATVTPSDADQEVVWTSTNTAVATVNANGKVHPVGVGETVIIARVKSNEDLKAECRVNVVAWTVDYVEFDIAGDLNLEVGEQETVTATAYPTGHGFKVDYYTSDENIATVTIGGVVTGVAAGDAVITAKSGDKEAKLNVHVSAAPVPEEKGDISVADFIALKDEFNIYTLTGTVSNIKEDKDGVPYKRGEFDLTDATGTIYIYGILTPEGVADKFWDMNIDEKDTVTLKGSYAEYQGNAEIKNATLVSVKKYVEPVDPTTGINNVIRSGNATKVLREGQVIILRDEKEYNLLGGRVK